MAKSKKKIVMNETRLRQMGNDLFSDLDYKRSRERINKTEYKRRCTERHIEFLDLLSFEHQDPVKWVNAIYRNLGKDKVKKLLKESIANLELPTIYNKTKVGKKNLTFYKNANGYFQNKYLGRKRESITN